MWCAYISRLSTGFRAPKVSLRFPILLHCLAWRWQMYAAARVANVFSSTSLWPNLRERYFVRLHALRVGLAGLQRRLYLCAPLRRRDALHRFTIPLPTHRQRVLTAVYYLFQALLSRAYQSRYCHHPAQQVRLDAFLLSKTPAQ